MTTITNNKQDLDAALDFDLFEGDFGTPFDTELSNKIVTSRGEYKCHICAGEILKGENHRSTTWKFDGELMSYRCCNECCMAMVKSVNYEYEEDDPIEARYALGHQRRGWAA
ncbi:hypothetical protein LS97_002143 [Salmonella enterica subsp. enterica]|uniref:hypothetical protein n=1 Tax=Salmonella enterica TaxID=28901 RepID=UPI0016038C24|nr:hypothetical protein [Salmonella enterica]EDT1620314.1 hypothetical protein [Salmonella enterica subsp. enterica serovar Aberdeen]HAU6706523.1 hypothetical protein [Salmonella enterica subsp. enterica serovar Chingola]EDT7176936.1 hypothetical protein [Salmonella enterica subsp. enterica serovar Aberdeen]EED3313711.1 hypothetical protein [Salmonella enterica subsp. enterica serovar Aberdeen]ELD8307677.1 hypothetical protein [Salmonella enterica]